MIYLDVNFAGCELGYELCAVQCSTSMFYNQFVIKLAPLWKKKVSNLLLLEKHSECAESFQQLGKYTSRSQLQLLE